MANLFIPNKNGKRPNPVPSGSSQNGQNFASSQPPPAFNNNSRPRTVSNSNAQPGSSRALLPHTSLSTSQSLSKSPLPLDPTFRAQIETLLPRTLRLSQLQSQSLGSDTGSFGMVDLADVETDDLKTLWNAGEKEISDRDRKEREALGKSLVEDLGGLLMKLAEKVGTDLVDRKFEIIRREIESLKSSSSSSSSTSIAYNDRSSVSTPAQSSSALTNALDRIRVLEQKLQTSDQERDQLRQTLTSRDQLFEQRLAALENKTVDPRKRITSGGGVGGNGSLPSISGGASDSPTAQSVALVEIDKLRKEVEELRVTRKRARDSEEEEEENEGKEIKKLKAQVDSQDSKLQQAQEERDGYLQKLQTQSQALDTLSTSVSSLRNITELESSLLRGLYNFLSSTPNSQVESLSSIELSSLLTRRLVELNEAVQSYQDNSEIVESNIAVHGQQLALLHENLANLKPFFEYMSARALPDIQKSIALFKAREADSLENGGEVREGEGEIDGQGEEDHDQAMEESDEERAVERQLVNGTNGTRSSPADKDRDEQGTVGNGGNVEQ